MTIDFLVPELYASDGGIQAYSRIFIETCHELIGPEKIRVFVMNDNSVISNPSRGIEIFPANKSKTRFVKDYFKQSIADPSRLTISTHPNLSPVQQIHKKVFNSRQWCSAHGIDAWDIQSRFKLNSLAKSDMLLPVSQFTADKVLEQLVDKCPQQAVLPNCFDSTSFTPGKKSAELLNRYRIDQDAPIVVTLSRLSYADRYKNIDKLILAVNFLMERWPKIKLIICGDGDDKHRLQQIAFQLPNPKSVIFSGRVSNEELIDHLRLANVFALPSSGEGFGIVFLEAMGCGIPVIAGNKDGSAEPLRGGRFGLLVDTNQPLAPAIASVLQKKGPRMWYNPKELSRQVGSEFDVTAFKHRLYKLLSENDIISIK